MPRVGVFVCHCGQNIESMVDVERVAEYARSLDGVEHSTTYEFMCAAPGQAYIQDAIVDEDLDRVVVAACSPDLHGETFRRAAEDGGLNRYQIEIANIREQCSWVHESPERATAKAEQLIEAAVERVKPAQPLEPTDISVTDHALVVGGGVAGLRTALDIAEGGHQVTIVERKPSIGGKMAQLSETFPTLDCSQCILTPMMVEVQHHPNIEVITEAEVDEIEGYVGNFTAKIRQKAQYVDPLACTSCDDCTPVCPQATPNEFDRDLSWRKAIYIPFDQAVPSTYTLDMETCLNSEHETENYRVLACERCVEVCEPDAIDLDAQPELIEREVGAVVMATGYDLKPSTEGEELGYGEHPDILDGLEFERILSAEGPTGGQVKRPSDGKEPEHVAFVQCVGSRDPNRGVPYCSQICCMYTAKQALLYKHKVPDGKATVFYIDIRATGKEYEEFIHRVMDEERVQYIRGRVGRVVPDEGVLRVHGADTLSSQTVTVDADMVVLAKAIGPPPGCTVDGLQVSKDANGFIQESHPKLGPAETLTPGVFPAGTAQFPKDIPDSVSQSSAAASKTLSLFSEPEMARDPEEAAVDPERCTGCFVCEQVCPYGAIERHPPPDDVETSLEEVAEVNPAICEGCGLCVAECRPGAMELINAVDESVFAQLEALSPREELADVETPDEPASAEVIEHGG